MYKPQIISIAQSSPLGKMVLDYMWQKNQKWFIYGILLGGTIGIVVGYIGRGFYRSRHQ